MRILQKNKGCRSYMEISSIGRQDSYACQMLVNNRFCSIPECEYRIIDNEKYLLYKIDGLSLVSVRYGRISPEISEIMKLMTDLSEALTELEDYLLNPDDLVINMRSILYYNTSNKHKFLYVPDSNGGFISQVKGLLEDIMVIFDHDDREGTVKLYDFYSRLLSDNTTPEMFKELVIRPASVNMQIPVRESVYVSDSKTDNEMSTFDLNTYNEAPMEDSSNENMKKILAAGGSVAVIGITAIALLGFKGLILSMLMVAVYMIYAINSYRSLVEDEEIRKNIAASNGIGTEYISAKTDISGVLESSEDDVPKIRNRYDIADQKKNQNRYDMKCQKKIISSLVPFISEKELPIMLPGDIEIKIGRQQNCCEYCLSEPGISRIHAVIKKSGTKVSLRDEGSTNGTYVNNHRITGTETELNYGDIVSFAGVEYYCV